MEKPKKGGAKKAQGQKAQDPQHPAAAPVYEIYRRASIGVALAESIDELIGSGAMTQELGVKVMQQFDKSMSDALANRVKTKCSFKGHAHTYRFCDNVWTFLLENATFRTDTETVTVPSVKIVACDGKQPGQKEDGK